MPNRPAASRSMVSRTAAAADCWSEDTSLISGNFFSASSSLGVQAFSSSRSASDRVYWYCARPARPPTLMSWLACRKACTPTSLANLGRSRAITWSAVALRPSSLGLRLTLKLAWFRPPPPMKKCDSFTSGSLLTTLATCPIFSEVLAKDASCEVTKVPDRKPVSCWGKKPVCEVT